jgi:hypothetical protein
VVLPAEPVTGAWVGWVVGTAAGAVGAVGVQAANSQLTIMTTTIHIFNLLMRSSYDIEMYSSTTQIVLSIASKEIQLLEEFTTV